MLEAITPFATALFDRIRGGFPDERLTGTPKHWALVWVGRLVKWFGYGGVMALNVTTDWRLVLAAGVLFNLGERPGYQGVIGRVLIARPQTDPHGWQIGILRKSMPLALIVRGMLWALPVLPLMYWEEGFITFLPACIFGCLLAPYLVKYLPLPTTHFLQLLNKFPWQELIRGWLFGVFIVIGGLCYS